MFLSLRHLCPCSLVLPFTAQTVRLQYSCSTLSSYLTPFCRDSEMPCTLPSKRFILSKMRIKLWRSRLACWKTGRWRWASSKRSWNKKMTSSKGPSKKGGPEPEPMWTPWTCWPRKRNSWRGVKSSGRADVVIWRRASWIRPSSFSYAASAHPYPLPPSLSTITPYPPPNPPSLLVHVLNVVNLLKWITSASLCLSVHRYNFNIKV